MLKPTGLALAEIRLSERAAWELKTEGAAPLTLELGRVEPGARLARFVAYYPGTIAKLQRAGTRVEQVDLRYRNGFAARVPGFRETPAKKPAPDQRQGKALGESTHGQGRQESHRRSRRRYLEDRRDRRRGHAGEAAQHHRHGDAAVARTQEGRRRQHRGDDGLDPARARGSRTDGGLHDRRGVRGHRRQPHPQPEFERHGRHQGKGSDAGRHRSRHRDREGHRDSERSAGAAYPAAGIHRRRSGRRARAAGDERRTARGQGAHRDRRRVGGREHHQVRAALRARGQRRDAAAARVRAGRAERRREGPRRLPHGHRWRDDRPRGVHRRRDPPHGGHSRSRATR